MDRRTLLKTGLVSSLGLVAPVFSAKAQAELLGVPCFAIKTPG